MDGSVPATKADLARAASRILRRLVLRVAMKSRVSCLTSTPNFFEANLALISAIRAGLKWFYHHSRY